jgi:hypothetical protein
MPRINAAYDTFRLLFRSFLYEIFAFLLAFWLVEARLATSHSDTKDTRSKNQLTTQTFPSDKKSLGCDYLRPRASDAGLSRGAETGEGFADCVCV